MFIHHARTLGWQPPAYLNVMTSLGTTTPVWRPAIEHVVNERSAQIEVVGPSRSGVAPPGSDLGVAPLTRPGRLSRRMRGTVRRRAIEVFDCAFRSPSSGARP